MVSIINPQELLDINLLEIKDNSYVPIEDFK